MWGKRPTPSIEPNIVRELLWVCGAGLLGNWLDNLLGVYMSAVH